jgi:hypothetical protein
MADPLVGLCVSLQEVDDITGEHFQLIHDAQGDVLEETLQKMRNVMISHRDRASERVLLERLAATADCNLEVLHSLLACALALLTHCFPFFSRST